MKIEDLDTLRPEKNIIKIGGKEIDVSFIPCAITFDVDQVINELQEVSKDDLIYNSEKEKYYTIEQKLEAKNLRNTKIKSTFDLSIKLCAIFCEHKYPELDENYFRNECDAGQIKRFVELIRGALYHAYSGIDNSKNLKAPKKKNH